MEKKKIKKKKTKTKVIIISIIVGVVILGLIIAIFLYSPISQMIIGGGTGTSISQIIDQSVVEGEIETINMRPSVGETWLITSYSCSESGAGSIFLVDTITGAIKGMVASPDPNLRLFIDNNLYLRCSSDHYGNPPEPNDDINSFRIVGIRV